MSNPNFHSYKVTYMMHPIYLHFFLRQANFTKTFWDFWNNIVFNFHLYHISNCAFEGCIVYCIAHCSLVLYLDFQPFSPPNQLFSDSVQWILFQIFHDFLFKLTKHFFLSLRSNLGSTKIPNNFSIEYSSRTYYISINHKIMQLPSNTAN